MVGSGLVACGTPNRPAARRNPEKCLEVCVHEKNENAKEASCPFIIGKKNHGKKNALAATVFLYRVRVYIRDAQRLRASHPHMRQQSYKEPSPDTGTKI